MDPEEVREFVDQITRAIRSIAHGTDYSPGGLEGLSMAIAGDGLRSPLSESVHAVADGLNNIAESIDRLAETIKPEQQEDEGGE